MVASLFVMNDGAFSCHLLSCFIMARQPLQFKVVDHVH